MNTQAHQVFQRILNQSMAESDTIEGIQAERENAIDGIDQALKSVAALEKIADVTLAGYFAATKTKLRMAKAAVDLLVKDLVRETAENIRNQADGEEEVRRLRRERL